MVFDKELDFNSGHNVFMNLEDDLFASNKQKRPKWFVSKGGNLILVNWFPSTFDFSLSNGSGKKYEIRLRHPTFLQKLKYLFQKTEQFWEIYVKDDAECDKWVNGIDNKLNDRFRDNGE